MLLRSHFIIADIDLGSVIGKSDLFPVFDQGVGINIYRYDIRQFPGPTPVLLILQTSYGSREIDDHSHAYKHHCRHDKEQCFFKYRLIHSASPLSLQKWAQTHGKL